MYLENYIKGFENKKIKIFVDMVGTIVDYVVGNSTDFGGEGGYNGVGRPTSPPFNQKFIYKLFCL